MRDPRHIVLSASFLVIVFGVPITQAVIDLQDEMPPQFLDLFGQAPSEENLREFEDSLEENSFFEEAGRAGFQLFAHLSTGALGEKATQGSDGWYFYSPGIRYLAEPYFRTPRSASFGKVDATETIVDFAAQLKRRGIDLLVVPVPGKASIYSDRLTCHASPTSAVYDNTTLLRQELEERGVATLDLHKLFADARNSEPLYMASDTHWNGRGVRLAAKALAQRLREEGWARTVEAKSRYRRETIGIVRRGDIPEMTKIPGRETLFADEKVDVYQVHDLQTGELYKDSDDSPILLLGDSFSRVFQTDEPRAAGLIANLAFELQTPLTSIVNDGGASTLVREQLARRLHLLEGKRVVIWEFVERDIRFGMKGWAKLELDPEEL